VELARVPSWDALMESMGDTETSGPEAFDRIGDLASEWINAKKEEQEPPKKKRKITKSPRSLDDVTETVIKLEQNAPKETQIRELTTRRLIRPQIVVVASKTTRHLDLEKPTTKVPTSRSPTVPAYAIIIDDGEAPEVLTGHSPTVPANAMVVDKGVTPEDRRCKCGERVSLLVSSKPETMGTKYVCCPFGFVGCGYFRWCKDLPTLNEYMYEVERLQAEVKKLRGQLNDK